METDIVVPQKIKLQTRWAVLAAIVLLACAATAALKPIPQPAWYHNFADARTLLGVPNAENVLSNLPFVVVGLMGLYFTGRSGTQAPRQRWALLVLFTGLLLTGFGSGYYHLAPDNQRLFWDRLPMTIAMAGIISFLFVNRVVQGGLWILPVLLVAGGGSVLQWSWSEQQGKGDLRWYLLYQAMAFVVGMALLLLFPRRGIATRAVVIALLSNIAAKVFELLDKPIYAMGGLVSGHTLKHLAASLGFIPFVLWMASQDNSAGES
ncbi:MAG TPA: ceramidase domain-containing protein [Candidatus Angelobacter sp.]